MSAATLDLDLLNELFDNQKKLDDILSDDFSIFKSSSSTSDYSFEIDDQKRDQDLADLSYDKKSRNITSLILPMVVEIAVITYALMYFS